MPYVYANSKHEVTQSEDGIDLGPEVTSEEDTDTNPLAAIMDFYRREVATDLTDPKQKLAIRSQAKPVVRSI